MLSADSPWFLGQPQDVTGAAAELRRRARAAASCGHRPRTTERMYLGVVFTTFKVTSGRRSLSRPCGLL